MTEATEPPVTTMVASAPELLTALKALVASHDAEHNDSRDAIDNARAAIAKAAGGAE